MTKKLRHKSDTSKAVERPLADEALAIEVRAMAHALNRIADALIAGTATEEQRRGARLLYWADRGVPQEDQATVLCLNVAGLIEQARSEGLSPAWVWRKAMALRGEFGALTLKDFEDAMHARAKGPRRTVRAAAMLIEKAGISRSATLGASASNLRAKSKHLNSSSSR